VLPLRPMLLGSSPARPPAGSGWAYELKWDGMRVLCDAGPAGVRVWSRNGTDFTSSFPELAGLPKAVGGRRVLLDGELVSFGADGRTSFGRIRRRWSTLNRHRAVALVKEAPATLVAFDLLVLDGVSQMDIEYEERKRLLASLRLGDRHWIATSHHVGDGAALLEASRDKGLEGLVAKRLGSHYHPGIRSGDWQKIKNYQLQTFVIIGWRGDSSGMPTALLLGQRLARRLVFAGTVELGLERLRHDLRRYFAIIPEIAASPLHERSGPQNRAVGRARYIRPVLAAQVRFVGWDGAVIREGSVQQLELAAAP
jgi:bifunctional non-homologous end joining protein LigD